MQFIIGVSLTALAVALMQGARPRHGVERSFMLLPGVGIMVALVFTMLFASGLVVMATGLAELL